MQKLILVHSDIRLGPNALVQFPPEENFPPKKILLKIWAQHETNTTSNFISVIETDLHKKYCSLHKHHKPTNKTYFILLELDLSADERIYQEILENVANDLINNYGKPHFSHVLSETYRTIKNYSEMDNFQLFFRIFDDNIRIKVLDYLRKGVITKYALRNELKTKFGYVKLNLDLLLTPFLRLGLIKIKDVPGSEDSIFLISDIFAYRQPPSFQPKNPEVLKSIENVFSQEQIISDTELHQLLPLFENFQTLQLIKLLSLKNGNGIAYEIVFELLRDNKKLLDELNDRHIIFNDDDKFVYLISEIHFKKFSPKYLIPLLKRRYNNGEISMNQVLAHVELISNGNQ
ncbi:MAG: hypothetical protein ACTSVZ_09050 [Promethearchaeota archaeon]